MTKERRTPIKRDPHYQGIPGLNLKIANADIRELTDQEKAEKFLSKYQEVVDPLITYKDYFDSTAKDIAHSFLEIKRAYINLVISGKWTERKYVAVINHIFETKVPFNVFALDRFGMLYENGSLTQASKNNSTRRVKR